LQTQVDKPVRFLTEATTLAGSLPILGLLFGLFRQKHVFSNLVNYQGWQVYLL